MKYRLFDKDEGRYVTEDGSGWALKPDGIVKYCDYCGDEIECDWVRVERATGVTDMNGNEIFEGDIVDVHVTEPCQIAYRTMVYMNNGAFVVNCPDGNAMQLDGSITEIIKPEESSNEF